MHPIHSFAYKVRGLRKAAQTLVTRSDGSSPFAMVYVLLLLLPEGLMPTAPYIAWACSFLTLLDLRSIIVQYLQGLDQNLAKFDV